MRAWARFVLGAAFALALAGAALLAALGVLPWSLALDVVSIGAAGLSLLALVKIPWDVWFAARLLVAEQTESANRGIAVPDEARREARRIAARALAVALGLHVLAAAAALGASLALGEPRALVLAVAYLASMGLRPLEAGWAHLRARIATLRGAARAPRQDAVTLAADLRALGEEARRAGARVETLEARLEAEAEGARSREAKLEARLDRVLVELERSAERLTTDRDLVAGLHALARLLRSPAR